MNLGQSTTRLNTFQGLDLTDSEARDLYNEGRRRFALRSKYPRKTQDIGPTVAEQAAYEWPDDLLLPLSVSVAGQPWGSGDPDTVRQIQKGLITFSDTGLWYERTDESGARKLYLYPTPGEELALEVEWVYRPTPLVNPTDEPTELPEEFHDGPLYEAAAIAFEGEEDNVELATYYSQKAETRMRELMAYDNIRRSGNGIFRIPIAGVTAR